MCCGPWLNEVLQELKDAQTTKGTRRTIDNICSATFGGKGFDVSAYSFDKTTGKSASKYQCMLWYAQANGVACMCAYLCVCVMHLSLCMCGGLGGTYFLFCATDRSDWILFVCHAYMFCTYFINQAYLVGQKHAITTWLRKGCVEKGQGGSILTIAVSLKYAMRPE